MVGSLRLGFVTELFLPDMGGMQYRYLQLCQALAKRGHEVTLYTTDFTREGLPREEEVQGIHVRRYVKVPSYRNLPGTRPLLPLLAYSMATRRLMPEVEKASDAIIINQMPIAHLPWLRATPKTRVDWCEVTEGGLRGVVFARSARRFVEGFAVSEHVLNGVAACNPRGRFTLLRTPLDVDSYPTGPKVPEHYLYVGRMIEHKNPGLVVETVRWLHDHGHPAVELDLAGDGPLIPPLREAARGLSYIRVHGQVGEEEKRQLYAQAQVFLLPSVREGLPNAIVEAVASGTPVITTDAPRNGSRDFVRRHAIGKTMRAVSRDALSEAILELTGPAWSSARENCLRLREEFRYAPVCETFERVTGQTAGPHN